MVGKKDADKENKTVQIKATTGAWWKSTTSEVASDAASETPEPEQEAVTPVKAKSRPRKRTPRKTAVEISPEQEAGTAQDSAGEQTQEKEKKSAPARKRSGRRPKKKTDEVVEDILADTAAVTEQKEVGSEIETVVAQVVETAAEEKDEPKRPRGRRGRGRKKATTADKPAVAASVADDDAEPAAEQSTLEEAGLDWSLDADSENALEEQDAEAAGQTVEEKSTRAHAKEETKKVCKLLINAEEPEECRLALLEDGRLESIHVSTISRTQTKSNIYKARIVAIEPSLQAAFVDYGTEKNGFLPFSEIHPEYYKQDLSAETLRLVENNQWKKLNITNVIEKGQEILAQVVKEEVGKKGANMTTFLSIPGRCVVLMPGSDSAGISRKISGEQRRSQLRDTMLSMNLPEGIGWIVRTASVDITQDALARDVEYLLELWNEIKNKGQEMDGVGLVYEDHRSVLRFLREHFDPSIQEILVDDRTALEQVKEFVKMLPEQQRTVNVRFHQGARPIFNQYSVEDQIESIYQSQVSLPSGGSIVIDPTEALVAIDVNSGSTSKGKNFEASIFQANMEAAAELARQLRLRDLGGLIVVDFIDMRNRKHILAVEREVKTAMKKDKAKVDFSRISKFGLMEISRQKLGAPIEAGNYRRCEHCKGRGTVRSVETLSLYYLRRIQTGASRKQVEAIECHFPLDVAAYLLNNKRSELAELEKRYQVEINIVAEVDMKPADNEILFHKAEKENISKKQA
ncbi:Rne/Rng family ribonuclease [Desulfopila sp. IMCC35006]|uniref:Rne/Rng family ribonuclease n=1 Tax=Desulfopila sp. IMCC35006 TaxID=2569542 RepID=UPI0010AC2CFC|nr:Rne/Rng family ribonuclease [Desulfopila sp. IMCC35006]TKB28450.1 Rne/Rng family ribonuclease [Desulfopila sp. IMCC35006]